MTQRARTSGVCRNCQRVHATPDNGAPEAGIQEPDLAPDHATAEPGQNIGSILPARIRYTRVIPSSATKEASGSMSFRAWDVSGVR